MRDFFRLTHNQYLNFFQFRGVEFLLRSFLYNSSIKILFSSTLKQSELEIDAILNENKIRPPSLFEVQANHKREVVYAKHFSHPSYTISIRPFSILKDLPFVLKVLEEKYKSAGIGSVANTIAASYMYTGSSDMIRSFACLLNDRLMLGAIDIVDALYDELSTLVPLCEGDYIIRLMVNSKGKTVRPLVVKMLTTCMEYFFLFPEVKQLFIALDPTETTMMDLVKKCGFFFYNRCVSKYSTNIFCCDRQSLIV
jgi:hypothetical protein